MNNHTPIPKVRKNRIEPFSASVKKPTRGGSDFKPMAVSKKITHTPNTTVVSVKSKRGVEGGASQVDDGIFPGLLNEQASKYNEFKANADVLVPEKILERPQRRLEALTKLKQELGGMAREIDNKINELFTTVRINRYDPETDEGLLEVDFAEYEDCFFSDVPELTRLLDTEMARLNEEYAKAQEESKELVSQLDNFL